VNDHQIHTDKQTTATQPTEPVEQPAAATRGVSTPDQLRANTGAPTRTAVTAAPPEQAALRKQLMPLLFAYEYVPVKKDFEGLASTDKLVDALTAIYRDKTVHLHPRTRALACLQYFPGPTVQPIYEEALTDPNVLSLFRRSATTAYTAGFGNAAFETTKALLKHSDMHTRVLAVKSLARMTTPEAITTLKAHLHSETAPKVIQTVQSKLAVLGH